MSEPEPRYAPSRPFPPYTYLPGRDPHPTRDPHGHSYGHDAEGAGEYLDADRWRENEEYLYGVDLYNHGYLWESHEAWEGLWHPAKHDAMQAEHLQGLIQCAAAALKIEMGQPKGLAKLAELGTGRLERVAREAGAVFMGVDLLEFLEAFREFAASEPSTPEGRPRIRLG